MLEEECRIQNPEFSNLDARGLKEAALSVGDWDRAGIEDHTSALLSDHQIENLVGVLNPIIHPPVAENSFRILTPDS